MLLVKIFQNFVPIITSHSLTLTEPTLCLVLFVYFSSYKRHYILATDGLD